MAWHLVHAPKRLPGIGLNSNVWRRIIAAVMLIAALIVFIEVPLPQTIDGPCVVQPIEVWYLARNGAGQVISGWEGGMTGAGGTFIQAQFERPDFVEVLVSENVTDGAAITAGDTVAIIKSINATTDFYSLKAQLRRAKSEWEGLNIGAKEPELQVSRQEIKQVQSELNVFDKEFTRSRALYDSGYISKAEWDIVSGRRQFLEAKMDVAIAALAAQESSERPVDIDVALGNIARLESLVDGAKLAIEKMKAITSPLSGRIRIGENGEKYFRVERVDSVIVAMAIPEGVVGNISSSHSVEYNLFANKHLNIISKVSRIVYGQGTIQGAFIISILANSDGHLQAGMRGTAKIRLSELTVWEGVVARLNR